jgi:hypothetical protein
MRIPTTEEEILMLLKNIHKDCHPTNGHCDLTPLVELMAKNREIINICRSLPFNPVAQKLGIEAILLICHGIKIGYQIRNPETVEV